MYKQLIMNNVERERKEEMRGERERRGENERKRQRQQTDKQADTETDGMKRDSRTKRMKIMR